MVEAKYDWESGGLSSFEPHICSILASKSRGGRIRTGDHLNPIQVRYLAALRPEAVATLFYLVSLISQAVYSGANLPLLSLAPVSFPS